ncbi:MRG-domain-containing protein, partial [Dimargaris cristalligena]
ILKADFWTGKEPDEDEEGPHYLIHYKGWKQTWDEWVPETRVLKYDAENLDKQRQLKDMHSTKKKSTAVATGPSTTNASPNNSHERGGRKRPRDPSVEKEEEYVRRPEIRIPIPNPLKALLVDDWEHITKDHQIVPLPRKPTVNEILALYQQSKSESASKKKNGHDRHNEDILEEILEGLKLYFNRALGNILLYRFERLQFSEVIKKHPDTPVCDIYGAEHLLRLFVQLPSLIAHTNMDAEAIALLKEHLADILKFLQKNTDEFFTADYDNASPAYIAESRA